MSFFSSLRSGGSIDTSIEIYSDSEGERDELRASQIVKESFVEKQLPRQESPFVPLAHLFPLSSTQEAHQTRRRPQEEGVEQEEMVIDNPFVPPVPPVKGNWLMDEGPKNMLMIEAPPLDYLPRVVDRMDDVVEKEVEVESDRSGQPLVGKVNGNSAINSEEDASDDDIVYRGMSSRVEVKPAAEESCSGSAKRKRVAPVKSRKVGGSRVPAIPTYRYAAGKMTADEFIAAADTFHLVVEQEGSAGRIGRALMEFDLKPRKFSTGSYGWAGHLIGDLPTNKGNVSIRTSVNLIVKGSKPIVVQPRVPAGRK